MLSFLSAVVSGCINDKDESRRELKAGDEIPTFSVTTLDGVVVNSESFRGKRGAIVFFTTICGDCRRELPLLEKAYRELKRDAGGDDFELICISRSESAESVERFWQENDLTMPVAAEDNRVVYEKFASSGVPRLFLIENCIITASHVEAFPASPFR